MGQIYTLLHSAIQSRESKETVARGATAPNTSAWLRHTEEPAAKVIRAPQSRDATKNRTLYTVCYVARPYEAGFLPTLGSH